MHNKNTVAQQKATGTQGKFGHLRHHEIKNGDLTNNTEQGSTAWLNELPGSEWDIRYVPVSPLRAGVEARIHISERTANFYAHQLEAAEEHANDDLLFGAAPANSTFELVETVRTDKMSTPDLVAITPDGTRQLIGSQADLPLEHEFEPVLIDGDGSFWDQSTMRHVTSEWSDAIEAEKELDEERVERCHDLIGAMGWKITPYNVPRNEWMIDMRPSGGARVMIDRNGELTETNNYRKATTNDLAEAISQYGMVSDDTVDMVRETLRALASHPTPEMKHWVSKSSLINELESLYGRSHADLAKAQKIVDILAGKAETPARGDIAKTVSKIKDDFKVLKAAEQRHAQAKIKAEQFEAELDTLTDLPPLIKETLKERLETLTTSESAYGGEVFKANEAYQRSSGMWQKMLDEQQKIQQRRDEINQQLTAMDNEFDRQQQLE